jgi:hypothetical protein
MTCVIVLACTCHICRTLIGGDYVCECSNPWFPAKIQMKALHCGAIAFLGAGTAAL